MITIVIYMLCIGNLLYYVNKHQEKETQPTRNLAGKIPTIT